MTNSENPTPKRKLYHLHLRVEVQLDTVIIPAESPQVAIAVISQKENLSRLLDDLHGSGRIAKVKFTGRVLDCQVDSINEEGNYTEEVAWYDEDDLEKLDLF